MEHIELFGDIKGVKLIHGDCITGIPEIIKENSIDVVVTSPPYNIGVKYNQYCDNLPISDYLEFISNLGKTIKNILSNDGSFFLNVGSRPSEPWIPFDILYALRPYFTLQNIIIWVKSIAISKADVGKYPNIRDDVAVGHFKPLSSKRFLNDCFEFIFQFTKSGNVDLDKLAIGVPYQDKSNIGRYADKDRRDRGNTWFIPYETIRDRAQRPHPSTFPVKLPEMCLKLHGIKDEMVVLDPFIGTGSTAIAAERLGVSCIGFDVDSNYLKICADRLRNAEIRLFDFEQYSDSSG